MENNSQSGFHQREQGNNIREGHHLLMQDRQALTGDGGNKKLKEYRLNLRIVAIIRMAKAMGNRKAENKTKNNRLIS